ncbi:hypothetical protein V7128_00925 [Neobacillus vireti]|uniref:hypothetical protein n=1 Tax=Neobacillus vireti TaxID=220686 RepID=UPI002FFDDA6E
MKKSSKIFTSTLLGLVLVSSSVYAATDSNKPSTLPDKGVIKQMKHYNKIKDLTESNQSAALTKYIRGLSEKELFETAEEMIKGNADFEREGMILVPAIKEKWKNGPSKEAYKLIRDKGFTPKFREHVLDAMFSNQMVEKSLEDGNIINEVTSLVNDPSEDEMVRVYALKKLRAGDKVDHAKLKLEKLVFDANEPTKIRGAAIVAMHRTKDPSFEKTMDKILKDKAVDNETLLQYAIVETAKANISNKYMKEVKELSKQKNSKELNNTISYAMAITGGKEAIKFATTVYDENNKEISAYTFRTRMYDVMDLLNSSDSEDVEAGIKASIYGQIANALPKLKELKQSSTDVQVQKLAAEALATIDPAAMVDESVLAKVGK